MSLMEMLLVGAIAAPGVLFAALAVLWLLGAPFPERPVVRLTQCAFGLSALSLFAIAGDMLWNASGSVMVPLGEWFSVGDYRFSIDLLADRLSVPMMVLTATLTGLVATFSARYLHREPGFLYFFLLLQLFGFGSLLLFAAASFDLIVAGWELVGLTSVLLIAYFHERQDPVSNGLRVFAIYRICDVGLLTAVVALHHFLGTASVAAFDGVWPRQTADMTPAAAGLVSGLLLFAAMGKAAQFPFSGWLPRAMEGPTPSSAIFYGAISVHAGAYLLLRAQPLLDLAPSVRAAAVVVGLLSAGFGILIGRACTDAKTSLAYASVAQLGLIFAEIGLGFQELAMWHICGHAVVRTLQFLRAPSALHEFHQMHSASNGHLAPVGSHHEAFLPLDTRRWLYRLALDRGHMDTILDRFVLAPMLSLSHILRAGAPSPPVRARPKRIPPLVPQHVPAAHGKQRLQSEGLSQRISSGDADA